MKHRSAAPAFARLVPVALAAFVTAAALAGAPGVAAAEPTAEALQQRRDELAARHGRDGFTVVVEPPFVVIGDEPAARVKQRASGILRWSIKLLEAEYFKTRPSKVIEIWLFKNETTYRKGAKKYFDDEPETPYGYYSSEADAMVMNIGPGAGTLVHEVVHPYIEANFPDGPAWFNEGLASLYERPVERKGHIWGLPNWRLPNLKKQLKDRSLPALGVLLKTSPNEFYGAEFDSYAYARYLLLYLQEEGKLTDFYQKFVADEKDRTGKAALEAVLGEPIEAFEPKWRRWAAALHSDNR